MRELCVQHSSGRLPVNSQSDQYGAVLSLLRWISLSLQTRSSTTASCWSARRHRGRGPAWVVLYCMIPPSITTAVCVCVCVYVRVRTCACACVKEESGLRCSILRHQSRGLLINHRWVTAVVPPSPSLLQIYSMDFLCAGCKEKGGVCACACVDF